MYSSTQQKAEFLCCIMKLVRPGVDQCDSSLLSHSIAQFLTICVPSLILIWKPNKETYMKQHHYNQ